MNQNKRLGYFCNHESIKSLAFEYKGSYPSDNLYNFSKVYLKLFNCDFNIFWWDIFNLKTAEVPYL
jgi:hypothetical protein